MMLANFWFLIIGVALMFYAMLDGFDLGVGMLHPFARDDTERRIFLNAIGPVWDGNEVWLVIVGGALFAGFTDVYATIFSAYYTPLMALLAGLILRAVAIEFRSKVESSAWRHIWDWIFAVSSLAIAFIAGLLLGSLVQGIPLDPQGNFIGTFSDFISPFTILVGMTACALFAMHGNVYLLMKTEGSLHDHMRSWVKWTINVFIFFYLILTVHTLYKFPYMLETMVDYPFLFIVPLLTILAIIAVPYFIGKSWDGSAFVSSCIAIMMLFLLFGIGTYPIMVRSTVEPATRNLTVFNSHSSQLTLTILAIIVAIGVPMVLAYGTYIYRVFRGKVRLDDTSY